jgi:hypothetical protein
VISHRALEQLEENNENVDIEAASGWLTDIEDSDHGKAMITAMSTLTVTESTSASRFFFFINFSF